MRFISTSSNSARGGYWVQGAELSIVDAPRLSEQAAQTPEDVLNMKSPLWAQLPFWSLLSEVSP